MSAIIKLSSPETQQFWEVPVLYEDAQVLALDKPSGLPISPDRYDPDRPSLLKLLHAGIAAAKPWARERGLSYLMNTHRLDLETSGVLLLAKDKATLIALANLFGSEKPLRHYVALVQGDPAESRFEVNVPLAPDTLKPGVIRVDPRHGKKSFTRFEVRERFRRWALVQCEPRTERRHQIRVHLRHARLPVVGDALYGGRPLLLSSLKHDYHLKPGRTERPLMARVALHAEKLALTHPATGQPLSLEAPWPKDLRVAVKYLRQFCPTA